jgi:hypothetical protein
MASIGSVELKITKSKFGTIKKTIKDILLFSTIHGVPEYLRSKKLFFKLLWLIFTLISFGACNHYIFQTIFDYLKFNTVTSINVIREQQSTFPSFTLCGWPSLNVSLTQIVRKLRFNGVIQQNHSQYFESYIDNIYGLCYRFNTGKNMDGNEYDLLKSTTRGLPNGLKAFIYLTVPNEYDYSELLINFHNHSSPPINVDDGCFWITSGTWNYFQVERIFTEKLGEPYNDCLKELKDFKLNRTIIDLILSLNRIYSQTDCHHFCSLLAVLDQSSCGCNSSLNRVSSECIRQWFEPNEISETKKCVEKFLTNFRKESIYQRCNDYCPLECDSMSYIITPYTEHFPVGGKIGKKNKIENDLELFETYEQVNKYFLNLEVYYKDLRYTYLSDEPKTEFFDFISNIGGILGVFLGISFLSFIEIVEIFFEILFIMFDFK